MKTSIIVGYAAGFVSIVVAGLPGAAQAKGGFFPVYHPKPCSGADCRADDPRAGAACQGFICGFSSSKAMQPPVTAAQAAEAEKARAAAAQAAAASAPPPAVVAPLKAKRKRVVKIKAKPAASVPARAAASEPAAKPATETK